MPDPRHPCRPWDGKRESRRRGQAVARLAARQHGVVARWQLREIGYGDDAINGWIARSGLLAVYRGVYAVGRRPLTGAGRCLAAVLAGGRAAALSDRPAAWVWDLNDAIGPKIHVTVSGNRRPRVGLIFHRRPLPDDERTVRDGIPITTVARTILDAAATESHARLRQMIAIAESRALADSPSLPELLERYPKQRGRGKLLAIMDSAIAEGVADRELELRFAEFVDERGLPRPRKNAQVAVPDGRTFKVDCYWPEAPLVVELDSRLHHSDWESAEADRARDAALIAVGIPVIRVTWRRLHYEPAQLAGEIVAAIEGSHVRRP